MSRHVPPPTLPPPDPGPPPRGPLRRFLEARGVVGGHSAPHAAVRLTTDDGTRLAASYLPGRADAPLAVLLLHGFAASRRKPAYARLADTLAAELPVLALDLRGHGASAGASTLGDREVSDVRAGTRWLERFGHPRVVVVGASMGGTAALHAASRGVPVAGVVTVSAPAFFRDPPETSPLLRLDAVWRSPLRRAALRAVLGVSLAGPEAFGPPPAPVRMAAAIDEPLLVVHGRDDAYFPVSDAHALVGTAGGPAVLWEEPVGFGHAEDGFGPAFLADLRAAIVHLGATGRFPARSGTRRGP